MHKRNPISNNMQKIMETTDHEREHLLNISLAGCALTLRKEGEEHTSICF